MTEKRKKERRVEVVAGRKEKERRRRRRRRGALQVGCGWAIMPRFTVVLGVWVCWGGQVSARDAADRYRGNARY